MCACFSWSFINLSLFSVHLHDKLLDFNNQSFVQLLPSFASMPSILRCIQSDAHIYAQTIPHLTYRSLFLDRFLTYICFFNTVDLICCNPDLYFLFQTDSTIDYIADQQHEYPRGYFVKSSGRTYLKTVLCLGDFMGHPWFSGSQQVQRSILRQGHDL